MKSSQIQIGSTYVAKVSGRLTTVRVLGTREVFHFAKDRYSGLWRETSRQVWDCRNTKTGRKIVVKSPQRFRYPARKELKTFSENGRTWEGFVSCVS